jgi:hypothetical protein
MLESIKDLLEDLFSEGLLGVIILFGVGVLVSAIIYFTYRGVDYTLGHDVEVHVKVIEKMYTPSQSGTGVGTIMTHNGTIGTAVTTTHTREKYVLMVQEHSGEAYTHQVSATQYVRAIVGDEMPIKIRIGKFSNKKFK